MNAKETVEKFNNQFPNLLLGLAHYDKGKKIKDCPCPYCQGVLDE